MRIKDDFLLREVAGSQVVVPTGQRTMDFNGMITLNTSGAYLWKLLKEEQTTSQLIEKLVDTYDISEETAQKDVMDFIKKLEAEDLLE